MFCVVIIYDVSTVELRLFVILQIFLFCRIIRNGVESLFPFCNQFSSKYIWFSVLPFQNRRLLVSILKLVGMKFWEESLDYSRTQRITKAPSYYIFPIWQCQWTTQSIPCLLNCRHRINAMHYTVRRPIESVHDCSILVFFFHSTSFSSCLSPMRSIFLWHICIHAKCPND